MEPRRLRPRYVSPWINELICADTKMRIEKGWMRWPDSDEICPYASPIVAAKQPSKGPDAAANVRSGGSAQLKMGCVMGPRLRRWTRPCQASRGDLPLPLGRSPTFWAHVQEDSRKEHSRTRPAGSGLDLGGQQTSRVLKGLSCPLFRQHRLTEITNNHSIQA